MNEKSVGYKRILLRIILTVLCILAFAWIFSNSLKTGEASSQQSQGVVDSIQSAAGVIAPDSSIANATGKDYEKLHMDVRTLAHFLEFTLLGALLIWCYFSYTSEKKFLVIPVSLAALTPFVDEFLQLFSSGRGAQISDVATDMMGLGTGMAIAFISLAIGVSIYKKRLRERAVRCGGVSEKGE